MIKEGAKVKNFKELLYRVLRDISDEFSKVAWNEENEKHKLVNRFLKKWFTDYKNIHNIHNGGKAYFFLFRKNLKVTNIQFSELLALLQTYNEDEFKGHNVKKLIFMSFAELKDKISDSLDTLWNFDSANRCDKIIEIYSDILYRVVVVDSFFGSCAVFIPPHLKINLEKICGDSGYIHSCGRNVFTRKIGKTTKEEFFCSLKDYLGYKETQNSNDEEKIFFTAYSHEYHTTYDRHKEAVLRSGLDDVKVYEDKLWMGKDRLVSVIRQMEKEFGHQLQIPAPGDYRQAHKDLLEKESSKIDRNQTIWLIVDHSIDSRDYKNPGQERYYICYAQEFVNENPFHIFDEDKPAWIADITMPHTLTGAMINITRPWWDTSKKVSIADPFGGTATTWFESLKFSDKDVECVCSDVGEVQNNTDNQDDLAKDIHFLLAKDNLEVFSASCEKLNKLGIKLNLLVKVLTIFDTKIDSEDIVNYLEEKEQGKEPSIQTNWQKLIKDIEKDNEENEKLKEDNKEPVWCSNYPKNDNEICQIVCEILKAWREAFKLGYFELIPEREHEKYGSRCQWTQDIINDLYKPKNNLFNEETIFLYRILFYITLRTVIRHTVILEKRTGELLLKPETRLMSQENRKDWRNAYTKELITLISRLRELHKLRSREEFNQNNEQKQPVLTFLDTYSYGCSIGYKFLEEKFKDNTSQIKKRDVRDIEEDSYNLIVTDPPYGLNIKEKIEDLAKLYQDAFKAIINALKDDGQLVLGLPDRSHTGRQLPFFTQKDSVRRQIIAIAENEGFEIINTLSEVPEPKEIFQAPYYWESERALRRAILHFRFRRKNKKVGSDNM
jgi:tRNA G10  N-methylase Trm11